MPGKLEGYLLVTIPEVRRGSNRVETEVKLNNFQSTYNICSSRQESITQSSFGIELRHALYMFH